MFQLNLHCRISSISVSSCLNLYNLCHLSKARVVQFDELEGGQQLPCTNPPYVNIKKTEAGLLVVLLHRFKFWLSKSPAHRHWSALHTHPHIKGYVMTPSNRARRMHRFKAECDLSPCSDSCRNWLWPEVDPVGVPLSLPPLKLCQITKSHTRLERECRSTPDTQTQREEVQY